MILFNLSKAVFHRRMVRNHARSEQWQMTIYHFAQLLRIGVKLTDYEANLFNKAKHHFKQSKSSLLPKVAVCGWDLSHNAAGRVLSLADLYKEAEQKVSIIGCIVDSNPKRSRHLWQPMRLANIECDYFIAANSDDLLDEAYDFVSTHPFDVVHLSKPRLPNIILGRLYQLIWNSQIIMDVDDEEMGFSKPLRENLSTSNEQKGSSSKFFRKIKNLCQSNYSKQKAIRNRYWLNKSVNLATSFDALTVSNVALQAKYGGTVIPHVRNANTFIPSQSLRIKMRQKFNIPIDQSVVLFCGTPKPHKGLIETAKALSTVPERNVLFLIVGDFIDPNFKEALQSVKNVQFKFLPDQPYNQISKFVSMGDVCVCLQDVQSLISHHQLPAKVIDALSMGLVVITSITPALQPLIDAGVIMPASSNSLPHTLNDALNQAGSDQVRKRNRDYFIQYLSTQNYIPTVNKLLSKINENKNKNLVVVHPNTRYDLSVLMS